MNTTTTSDSENGCARGCWYEIVFPVLVFVIAFLGLVLCCKCSIEIVKRFLSFPNPEDHQSAERGRSSNEQNPRDENDDLPPSYSTLQMSLPINEAFPVESIELRHLRLQRTITVDTILPNYNEVEKHKKSQHRGQENLSFVTIATTSSSNSDLPPYEDVEDERENDSPTFIL